MASIASVSRAMRDATAQDVRTSAKPPCVSCERLLKQSSLRFRRRIIQTDNDPRSGMPVHRTNEEAGIVLFDHVFLESLTELLFPLRGRRRFSSVATLQPSPNLCRSFCVQHTCHERKEIHTEI